MGDRVKETWRVEEDVADAVEDAAGTLGISKNAYITLKMRQALQDDGFLD